MLPPSNTASETAGPAREPPAGRVVFVGAGPGDPGLLTRRAAEWLERADVILHDALVPAAVLAIAGDGPTLLPVPRPPSGDDDPGIAIGRLLVDLARHHRLVVRLKGGDPAVFARLAEEQQPLREARVAWEIVPGVTAALAAAAAAGVPLTSRSAASSVTLLTGHEACDKDAPLDFAALARLPGTLVTYMGVEQIATWSRNLIAAGKRGDTPVTVVSRCTWPDQRLCVTTLAECDVEFDRCRWSAPAIVIVGDVAGHGDRVARARGRLAERTVVITRPAGQGDELAALIAAEGGSSIHVPVIGIGAPESWQPLDDAIGVADTFDWIVFASANGVRAFCGRLKHAGCDIRRVGTARIAAIGPATAREASLHGIACDLVPEEHTSEGLVAALGGTTTRGRFLLVRANRGRETLRLELQRLGHEVVEVTAYASRAVDSLDADARAALDAARIDWITVTSGFIAESALRLLGPRLAASRVASISPGVSATLQAAGITPAAEAAEPSSRSLVEAMAAWEASHGGFAEPANSPRPAPLPLHAAAAPVEPRDASRR